MSHSAGKVRVYVPESVSHDVQIHEVEVRINAGDDPQKVLALIDYVMAASQGPYEGDQPLSAPGCDRQYEISEDVWAVTGDPGEGRYGVVVSPTGNDKLAEEKAREILAKWSTPQEMKVTVDTWEQLGTTPSLVSVKDLPKGMVYFDGDQMVIVAGRKFHFISCSDIDALAKELTAASCSSIYRIVAHRNSYYPEV